MKSIIKLFRILVGLAIVTVVAIIIYIASLDSKDYRAMIVDVFQEETGRVMTINGDVVVTIYPWLGVEINDVTIGNAPGFGEVPFLKLQHAMVRMKLMPLLQEQYEVDTVRVHGLSVNLMKDASGETNWSDVQEKIAAQQSSDTGEMPFAAIVLGGVNLQDISLVWDDQSTGTRSAISNLQMNTGGLVYGEPIDFNLTFDAVSNKPELVADVSLTTTLKYDLDNEVYDIVPLNFNTLLTGPNVPQNSTNISLTSAIRVDMGNGILTINDINFSALGTRFTGNVQAQDIRHGEPTIQTDMNLSGSDLSLLFKVAEIEPLATQLAALNDRAFSFNADITANMASDEIGISGMQASMIV
jgi:AsmA protein